MSSTTIKGILHTKSEINECYTFDATDNHMKNFNQRMYNFYILFNKNIETENVGNRVIHNNENCL